MEQFMINCIEILPEADRIANHSLYKNLKAGKYLLNDYYKLDNDNSNLTKNKKFLSSSSFYEKGINIQAIVGKNGCGKSTLMDLLFAAANNFAYMIERKENADTDSSALYLADLYVRIFYTRQTSDYVLTIKDKEVYLSILSGEAILDESAIIRNRINDISFYFDPKDEKVLTNEYKCGLSTNEKRKRCLGNFFYTIASNYSIQSFVYQNYLSTYYDLINECDGSNTIVNRVEAVSPTESWIKSIFHKNDGYCKPVVLNPFRDNDGMVIWNNELNLSMDRLTALLIFYTKNKENVLFPYVFKKVKVTYNPVRINLKFNDLCDNWIKKIITEETSKRIESAKDAFSAATIPSATDVFNEFEKYFVSKNNAFLQMILCEFGLNYVENNEIVKTAYIYLQQKILKITGNYSSFKSYNDIIEYDYSRNAFKIDESRLKDLLNFIKIDNSHITRKIRRTVNFLALANNVFDTSYTWDEDAFFARFDFMDNSIFLTGKNRDCLTVDDLNDCLAPPFFEYELYMDKKDEYSSVIEKDVNYRQISSGETQMLQTLSVHAYHISNLLSVPHNRIKYDNINLIFDEVELCFHPEFQRQFINRLVVMLETFINDYKKRGKAKGEDWKCFFNVMILTHSPFILSDIQPGRTLFLEENGVPNYNLSKKSTFAGNIGEMFYESMFMKNTVGQYAERKLNKLISEFKGLKKKPVRYLEVKKIIDGVSDSILKHLLIEKLERES
ncbi:hypothetical protein SAMN06298224_2803 [Fibrobacter sp. UWB16]|uniref:ATP-binding cassette domain-containing protein n=1 Tax=Fibrobacter sp. UWB16 TaxID=1945874 RepID=UPI000BD57008|nr:ABC transporter ATP-binding protein [Fibrobacter sp. UWB16]SOD17319.1 hypothetical protein SAMN06298224_2803 [Fibrobacter sp. UWB16]